MGQCDVSGCTVTCPSSLRPTVGDTLGAEHLLAAQTAGTPLSLKATIHIGFREHAFEEDSLGKCPERIMHLSGAANGGAVAAKVHTAPVAVQQLQKDMATVPLEMTAPAQQDAWHKSTSQSTAVLDAPITLPGVKPHSSNTPGQPSAARHPPGCETANGISSEPGFYNSRAPLWHLESQQIPAPQQQQKHLTPAAPRGHATDKPCGRLPSVSTALKRPAPGGKQQQQQQKRQRMDMLPGEHKAAGRANHHFRSRMDGAVGTANHGRHRSGDAAGAATEGWRRSRGAVRPAAQGQPRQGGAAGIATCKWQQQQRHTNIHALTAGHNTAAAAGQGEGLKMQLLLDTPEALAATGSGSAANASKQKQVQVKQRPLGLADPRNNFVGRSKGLDKAQELIGMKRSRGDTSGANIAPKRAAPAAASSPGCKRNLATRTGMGNRSTATTVAAGAGKANAQAAAVAANCLDRRAQLRSNKDYSDFEELEEGELADYDGPDGRERLLPNTVSQGRAKPAGARKQKQQGKQQGKLQSQVPHKAPRAACAGKAGKAAATKAQPAKPNAAHDMQQQPIAAAAGLGKSTLQPRHQKKLAKMCKPAESAHSGVSDPKRIKKAARSESPTSRRKVPDLMQDIL